MRGDAGRAEARRRFATPATDPHDARQWAMEDLLDPGARGRAHADARRGNTSARTALADLSRTVSGLADETDAGHEAGADGGDAT